MGGEEEVNDVFRREAKVIVETNTEKPDARISFDGVVDEVVKARSRYRRLVSGMPSTGDAQN